MKDKTLLVKNLRDLAEALGCKTNATKLTQLINERAGKKVIDRSYVARVLKHSEKDPANISLDKFFKICCSLNVDPWQMLHPMGFDSEGRSRASGNVLDSKVLKRAVKYSVSAAAELENTNPDFVSALVETSYHHMVSGNDEKLGIQLAKLSHLYK